MARTKPKVEKSIVAITKGGRWQAKKTIQEGLDLLGGIGRIVKKGDTVLLKPNMGYPEVPGMPAWTCSTDVVVLTALTELCREAGAKRVVVGDAAAHFIKASYMFQSTGIAALLTTVRGFFSLKGAPMFFSQKGRAYPHIYVRPGQKLLQGTLSISIKTGVEPYFIKGF